MRATGRAVLAASSDSQLAFEGYEGHGYFTYALLKGLRGGAKDRNGEVSVMGLGKFVSDEVPRLTKDRQFPIFESQELHEFPIGLAP